jgi:cytochrome c oxidase subunit 3
MDGLSPAASARAAQTLLFAFLATVVMLFAGFTSAWLIRRTGSDWGRLELPPLVYANTLVLALSSASLELARRARGTAWLRTTCALGLLFLVGQVGLWRALSQDGAFVADTPQGAFLLLLSAVHGLHLVGGLGALAWLGRRARPPQLTAVYWHFLGLTWLYVLVLLHLR